MIERVQASWERRASVSGTRLAGVLFRGLSEPANAAVHQWHSWIVTQVFAPRLPRAGRVLDLGGGYGRLSSVLQRTRPDCSMFGQDLALSYGVLFKRDVGPCACAKAEQLPFIDACFDGVMAVTCLMYAERKLVVQALQDIRRVLRPGGTLVMLDPGLELQRWIARLRRNSSRSPTGGVGFGCAEYMRMVEESGMTVVHRGGNPWLSSALLLPGIHLSHRASVVQILDACARRDCQIRGYSALALHRWIYAQRY